MVKKAVSYIRIPKKLFYGLLIVIGMAVAYWVFKPDLTPVDLGKITEGTFVKSIVDEGTTAFKEKHIISAPADGIVPTLDLEAGDPVKKGKVIFRFLWDRDFKVTSPVDGYILRVFEKDRRHVPRGTPILEVGDPSEMEIVTQLLSEEVIDVKVGQKALITNWGKNTPLEAKVTKIEPSAKEEVSALGVKEQRVNVYLEITSDRKIWKGLGDNFRVEVNIITEEKADAKLLPVGALFSHEGKPSIYIVENKKAKIKNVEIGDRNRDSVELLGELPVGTTVVIYPGSGLKDGEPVKERNR